jgi:hypothetical protein
MALATIETRDYMNCGDAAVALGLSADSVRRYCNNFKEGKTPSLKGMQIGREWLIHKSEIARYKRERVGKGRPVENGRHNS